VVCGQVTATDFIALDLAMQRHMKSAKVFGGLRVILIGDLCQLPPANGGRSFIKTDSFERLVSQMDVFNLSTQFRQSAADEDAEVFSKFMLDCRQGKLSPESEGLLLYFFNNRSPDDKVLRLCATREYAEKWNAKMLKKLDGELMGPLELKIGAPVMFTRNIYGKDKSLMTKYNAGDLLVSNGSRGTLVGCTDSEYVVDVQNLPFAGHISLKATKRCPLRLAWACTIHRAQGQTLDKVVVVGDGIFEAGQVGSYYIWIGLRFRVIITN